MGMKGKGRKRREANFRASHPDAARLAPPPASKDLSAVPSKLRRIMEFKETKKPGQVHAASCVGQSKNRGKESRGTKNEKQAASAATVDDKKIATVPTGDKQAPAGGEVAGKSAKPLSKRKREQEELLQLAEKFKAKPIRTGITEKRKKYLEEKKKKRLKTSTFEAMLREPEHEKIAFGDVVQAPPKLSYPVKAKIIMKEERPASHERVRLQAIEAYRQRRAGGSRLGKGPPLVVEGADATSK